MTTFLGIDGGGSKTTFLLVDDRGAELARVRTGASNYTSVGAAASRKALEEGLGQLPARPDVVCGGFAGAGRPEGRRHYTEALSSLAPEARVFVETDAAITYHGAIGSHPGLLLIAGTGSIVVGRRPDGSMFRTGGWGHEFGDDGGGFWIGRESIRAALRLLDFESNPRFRGRVARGLGLERIEDIVDAWSSGRIGVSEVAGLAPLIVEDHANEPAGSIVARAAAHLRTLVQRSAAKLGADSPTTAAAGGIATHPRIQELISIPFEAALDPPEVGAIRWARERMASSGRDSAPS